MSEGSLPGQSIFTHIQFLRSYLDIMAAALSFIKS